MSDIDADAAFFGDLFGDALRGKSAAERKHESLLRHNYNSVEKREPEDAARRKRLERRPDKWLQWYFPNIFSLPFSDGHRQIIDATLEADATGKDMVVAAPRGEGKTNILRYMSLFLVFTGRTRFVVVGGWQVRAASEAFSTWCIALTSERLVADYPEFCAPFAESTHASRLPRLHWKGESKPTGAAIKSAKMQIIFPDGRGAMAAGSLQGDIKGLNITTQGGESLRPEKLLLDDPQDVDRANDPVFVSETLHKIDTQWLCLAGPNTRISMMVACTIFAPNDVGESLGKRRSSVFIRIPRVVSWPDGFDVADSMTRTLWDKWFDLYCDEGTRAEASALYRRNKRTMCAGFAVSWKYRFDASKGDPDALFAAMVDYYTKGRDAFFSEYQNTPVGHNTKIYELTPQCVLSHRCALSVNVAPDDAIYIALTTDINYSYGITYEVAACTRSRTVHTMAEGVWCGPPLPVTMDNTNQVQRQSDVKLALQNFAAWVSLQPWRLDVWYIDAGGEQFETVTTFCRESRKMGGIARAMIGRAGRTYNPMTRTQVGRIRGRVYQCFTRESGRWYCFDADYYKEAAQTSYITPMGQPGSATLFDGASRDYAEQMCREVLDAKGVLESRTGAPSGVAYKWNTLPGKHDKLDTHAMMFAAFGYEGLLTSDAPAANPAQRTSSRNKRKVYNG
ncbi:MAG: phage terminase large subunit family protein [Kiritimatiellae bacterium]|nr:phage terminase large subunit family protein [Kiritimatiellia bacterium]